MRRDHNMHIGSPCRPVIYFISERKRPKSTSEITFVPNCDVRSDSDCSEKPLPVKPSSKRKIKDIESSSSEEYEFKEAKRAEEYRFVDMGSLEDLIQRVHAFSKNGSG